MFPITVTLSNIAELTAVMAALGASGVTLGESTPIKPAPKAEAPGKSSPATHVRGQRTAEAEAPAPAAPEKTVDAPSPAAASAVAEPPASTAAEFKYETLQKAVVAAAPKHGKAKLLEIAVKHGAPDFKSLPAAVWAAAHADVVALG